MLDKYSLALVKPVVTSLAKPLAKAGIRADQMTVAGFVIGLGAIPALAFKQYDLALVAIILNRIADGLDGALARLTEPTDRGAYLDIVLDFIFYSAVIFGFALANPNENALPAAALIFSFMGTGSSFLAFAIMAERRKLASMNYPNKGFFYINGIAEGTETIIVLIAMCLFPSAFAWIAWGFFGLCLITTVSRIIGGAHTLSLQERKGH